MKIALHRVQVYLNYWSWEQVAAEADARRSDLAERGFLSIGAAGLVPLLTAHLELCGFRIDDRLIYGIVIEGEEGDILIRGAVNESLFAAAEDFAKLYTVNAQIAVAALIRALGLTIHQRGPTLRHAFLDRR